MSVHGVTNLTLRRRGDGEGSPAWTGRGAAGFKGSAAAGSEAPEEPRGERPGKEGLQQPGGVVVEGRLYVWILWQRAAGKLAGPVPGSSELRLVPSFHEH